MAEVLPQEDTVDFKIKQVKEILLRLSCVRPQDPRERDERPYIKQDQIKPTLPNLPTVIPDEGSSVDPPTPYENVNPPFFDNKPDEKPPQFEKAAAPSDGTGDAAATTVQDVADKVVDMNLSKEEPFEYNMKNNTRGVFLLFNVVNFDQNKGMKRDGTDQDAMEMERTFQRLGFDVYRYDDPSEDDVIKLLETVASHDHSNMDCVAVGFLSHGNWDMYLRPDGTSVMSDRVMARDKGLYINKLTEPFRSKNCHKSLRGKPKLFFIQACRGEKLAERAEYYDTMTINIMPQHPTTASKVNGGGDKADESSDAAALSTPLGSATAEDIDQLSRGEDMVTPTTEDREDNAMRREDTVDDEDDEDDEDTPEEVPEDQGDNEPTWDDRQGFSVPESMPIYKDFLVAWSTGPGYFSFRNEKEGSAFIQKLCTYLNRYYKSADLLSILTWCNSDVAHRFQSYAPSTRDDPKKRDVHAKKQMPWYFSRLTKDLCFHEKPKLSLSLLQQTQPN